MPPEKELSVNVGSGPDYRDGWLNIDLSADSGHHVGDTVPPDVVADAHHLPILEPCERPHSAVQGITIDHVRLNHVIEHLEAPLEAIRECYRVLDPTGTIYVEVPDANLTEAERDDHLYSWTEDTLCNIVRRAGFEITEYAKREREWRNAVDDAHYVVGVKHD